MKRKPTETSEMIYFQFVSLIWWSGLILLENILAFDVSIQEMFLFKRTE